MIYVHTCRQNISSQKKKIVNLKKIRNVSNFRKIKKIQVSQAWWHTPMILALKDTEAGRSL